MNTTPPSIVIIHGHDLGRHLGTYGRGAPTPAIDAFADTALRFDRAFAPAPQCSPSRASLTTGKMPSKSGMLGLAHMDWSLTNPSEALPNRLRDLGYQTLLAGEQHEAVNPVTLGYASTVATAWPQRADVVAPAFAEALGELDASQPFFASVGFFEAHRPFDHPGYTDDDPNDVQLPPYLPDTPEVREDVAALNGRVRAFDRGVGAVLDALDADGRADSTIVVVTTDHGIAFPRAKGTLFDAGLEIALLIRWPAVTTAGSRTDALAMNMDLYPTLLRAAGGTPEGDVDGLDLRPVAAGEAEAVRDRFVAQVHWHDAFVPMRALRTETHKLILDFSGREGTYLPADVAGSPSGRVVRERELAGAPEQTRAPGRQQEAVPEHAAEYASAPAHTGAGAERAGAGAERAGAGAGAAPGRVARSPKVALYDLTRDPHERTDISGEPDGRELAAELRAELTAWMERSDDPLVHERALRKDER